MTSNKSKIIIAVETSADETGAAVLRYNPSIYRAETETLSSVIRSQIPIHRTTGGIIPEVSARAHLAAIVPVVEKALKKAKITQKEIDFVAVTQGPGLIPSLLVGVEFAKALAFTLGKPVLPVNHMLGHLLSPLKGLEKELQKDLFPMVSLVVSGGHTMLVASKSPLKYKVIGKTVDDAVGEAFDKVAKLLGLPYPGGPEVGKLALESQNPTEFPRPMITSPNYDFSFSGLKTAVRYHIERLSRKPSKTDIADICKGFEQAAVDVLVQKTLRAVKEYNAKSVSVSGGVSANTRLRTSMYSALEKLGVPVFFPAKGLSTDNAEMIGLAAAYMVSGGYKPKVHAKFTANPNLSL